MAVIPLGIVHTYREKNADSRDLVWHEWYPGIVELNRPKRKIIWLCFTSDWDLTSHVNEHRLLQNQDVTAGLQRLDVQMIKVDCTNRDPVTEAELQRYEIPAIPKNFLIPKNPSAPYLQLPELLSTETFLAALKEVQRM